MDPAMEWMPLISNEKRHGYFSNYKVETSKT